MPYVRKGRSSVDRRIAEVEAGIAEQVDRLRYFAHRAADTSEVEEMIWVLRKTLAALMNERQLRNAPDIIPPAPAALDHQADG